MPPSPPPPPLCAKPYAQCGGKLPDGKNWTGPSCCPFGYECKGNLYYKGCTRATTGGEAGVQEPELVTPAATHVGERSSRYVTHRTKGFGRS